ncbi:UNVERIFIED_CONTAM: AAA family ATPase [Actinomycetes bacterium ARC8]|nr:AAA family ATPase [Actinomycetes bacterium ARC8]
METNVPLDQSQLSVVTAVPDDRLFVVAGAGQGKTEVLISRILALEEQGINSADEILVLSFSRAAVEAVRTRASLSGIRDVGVLTFDAFAARLILDEGEEPSHGFDARIRQATDLLRGEFVPQIVDPLQHLLIDEAQDLVGDRADMVLALLKALSPDAGFTILGDPLQGIYDFQLDSSRVQITSNQLIDTIIAEFGAKKLALANYYRAETDETKLLIPVANSIRDMETSEANAEHAHAALDDFVSGQVGPDFLAETGALEPLFDDSTALLASTNFEVLKASEILWENNIEHVVRRRAQDMSLAPWVYEVIGKYPARIYPYKEILGRLSGFEDLQADEIWRSLKRAEGNLSAPEILDTSLLTRRLRSKATPLALTVRDSHRLTLSTVHRAKGLEFTNVLYLPPEKGSPPSRISWDTLRQRYVALSRAREQILISSFPRNVNLAHKTLNNGNTSVELRFFGNKRASPYRMEFGNDSIDAAVPFKTDTFSAQEVLNGLRRDDLLGRPISGFVDPESFEDDGFPRYILQTDDGSPIGRTSVSFAAALKNAFSWSGAKSWIWPQGFVGARVISLETATGNQEETEAAGLVPSGMWLVPRLTGLIRPIWKKV